MTKRGAPWVIIIILLIFFFPVGIGLMISKLHKDKEHYLTNGKGTASVGWVLVVMGALYLVLGLTGGIVTSNGDSPVSAVITMLIVCCAIGFALVMHGNKYKKLGMMYSRYAALIANSRDGSLDGIAAAYPKPYEAVCRDLQAMIDAGLFPECYLDLQRRQFVSPLIKTHQAAKSVAVASETAAQPVVKYKVVKCPNCNGTNAITEGKIECEYCGSPLESV